ncbi:ADP-ribosyltransferase domain-containing protein [Dietzia sp. 179-F 9C3 NHS]
MDREQLAEDLLTNTAGLSEAEFHLDQAQDHRSLQGALGEPQKTPAEKHLQDTEAALEQAQLEADEARKAYQRLQRKARTIKKNLPDGEKTSPELEEIEAQKLAAKAQWDTNKADVTLQEKRVTEAQQFVADEGTATEYAAAAELPEEERDAYLAGLSDDDVAAIGRYREMQASADINAALSVGGTVQLLDRERDTSVYHPATFTWRHGDQEMEVEGRLLDGDTAIHRADYGKFYVLLKNGDAYETVFQTSSKAQSVDACAKMPMLGDVDDLPDDAGDYGTEVWQAKRAARIAAAKAAVTAPNPDSAKKIAISQLTDLEANARKRVVDLSVRGPVEVDVREGRLRHHRRERERVADEAGEKARAEALAAGASAAEGDAAFDKARRAALGTPTRGGGVIPHFSHRIPPESLGQAGYDSLARSGIRAWGAETADDYSIIASRQGDVAAWGFGSSHYIDTSDISTLVARSKPFLDKEINKEERAAFTTYTGGSYRDINAAITGRNPNPYAGTLTTVSRLESAFAKLSKWEGDPTPMNVMRGTSVPSGWTGTTEEYLDKAFKVGSRMEIGKVTSCSTNPQVANSFSGHGAGAAYIMAIRTRTGLAVKSISSHAGEDEVIIPMGTPVRTVHREMNGIGGKPTVYLVEEALVAEAQDGIS